LHVVDELKREALDELFLNRTVAICLMILAAVSLIAAMYFLRAVLVPFTFAIFIYFSLSPFIHWLKVELRLPKVLSLFLGFLLFILAIAAVGYMVSVNVRGLILSSDIYQQKLMEMVDKLGAVGDPWGIQIQTHLFRDFFSSGSFLTWVRHFSGGLMEFIGETTLVLIFTFFLILGKSKASFSLAEDLRRNVNKYVSVKLFTSSLVALVVGAILSVLGVELAFMFGILNFFLNFIPNIGPLIVCILPIPVVLLQFGLGWKFGVAIGLPILVHFVIGSILDPKLMGYNLNLHPATVLLCLLFWGVLWGIPGMILAVPMTAIFKILLGRYPMTRPLSDLME